MIKRHFAYFTIYLWKWLKKISSQNKRRHEGVAMSDVHCPLPIKNIKFDINLANEWIIWFRLFWNSNSRLPIINGYHNVITINKCVKSIGPNVLRQNSINSFEWLTQKHDVLYNIMWNNGVRQTFIHFKRVSFFLAFFSLSFQLVLVTLMQINRLTGK